MKATAWSRRICGLPSTQRARIRIYGQTRFAATRASSKTTSRLPAYRPVKLPPKIDPSIQEAAFQDETIKIWRKRTLIIAAGFVVFFGSMYGTHSYVKGEPEIPEIHPGEDVSNRYGHIASDFDRSVDSTEFWMYIGLLRRWLVAEAKGNVLEVSVGTGRNSKYYKEDQCQSITMVDQSKEMIGIAEKVFKATHPKFVHHKFLTQSALDPLPVPFEGYDTVLQTMGLCSTTDPIGLLKRMAAVTKPETGRILLLEHGRGLYDWINERLDYYAPAHAHKFGCWWNKNIEQIIEDSGLEVVTFRRYHLGTTYYYELKPKSSTKMLSPIPREKST